MKFAELQQGRQIEAGPVRVPADEIIAFARKFDNQWFHTDPMRAETGMWHGLIASGWHTCAIAMQMVAATILEGSESYASPGLAYVKWPHPGRPNFMAVGAYDGMAAIYEVARKLNGKIDGDKAMAVLKGMKLTSPRGPIMIDPATRDIVQTVYVRKVEQVGGEVYNVEFDKFPDVKDPGK